MAFSLTHDDPARIGPYLLVARLGSGGMGTVYLARSPGGRTIALKTMHARIASQAEFRTRFRLEADAARVMGGRFGAQVVDADPLAETPWMATEYVLGPALDDAVALNGPLPEACVRLLGRALCEALGQLHASDVVHRDLKPSNILLTASGPKLIDFGIARAIGDDRLTRTGAAAGTPAFMSPEQATGQDHTALGDVFALAGVLLFAATGHGPFGSGQAADLLYRVRYGEPDLSGLSDALRPVLEPCFAKEADERPGTGLLGNRLGDSPDAFAEHLPEPVRADIVRRFTEVWEIRGGRLPPPSHEQVETQPAVGPTRMSRRKLLALSGGGLLTLATCGLGAWSLWPDASSGANGSGGKNEGAARPPNVPPKMAWVESLGKIREALNAPQEIGPAVVFFTEDAFTALDARTGKPLWAYTSGLYSNMITTDGERLYVLPDLVPQRLTVVEMEMRTGTFGPPLVDTAEFDSGNTTLLAVAKGSIFLMARSVKVGDIKKGWHILCYDLKTGDETWRQPTGYPMTAGSSDSDFVAAVSGRYLVVVHKRKLMVRAAASGEILWEGDIPAPRVDTGGSSVRAGQFALTETHFYTGVDELTAWRLKDGKVSWRVGGNRDLGEDFEDGDDRRYGPPTVRDGVVYVAEGDRGFIGVDAESGEVLWEQKKATMVPEFDSAPVVGEKYVYGTVDDRRWIVAIDRESGRYAWSVNGLEAGGLGRTLTVHDAAARVVIATGNVVAAIPLE